MQVEGKEAVALNEKLLDALTAGYQYVNINQPPDGKIRPEHLQYFADKASAEQAGFSSRSLAHSLVDTVPLQALQQQLDRRIEIQQQATPWLTTLLDVPIDLSVIRFQEKARADIFTEEIARQLRARELQVDLKALQQHIQADAVSFHINGRRFEKGEEHTYTILIAQDAYRGFQVEGVQRQERESATLLKKEHVHVTVDKEQLPVIKEYLRTEQENGKRFVTIPAIGELRTANMESYRSSIDALLEVRAQKKENNPLIVRSIAVMETEIIRLAAQTIEQNLPKTREQEPKKSRGSELSM